MDKLFDKLPYETLEEVKPLYIFAGAAGIGLLFLVVCYFTLIGAVREEYAQLQEKKVKTERTLKKYQRIVGQKDQIFNHFVQTSGKLSGLKRQMPKKEEILTFLKKITLSGKSLGVEMLNFKIREGIKKDYYIEIPIDLNFRGGLWNTMDFFESIQNMLRLVDFSKMAMTFKYVEVYEMGGPATAIDTVPMLHTSVIAKTYVYVEGAEDKVAEKKGEGN